jgi:hypothetical protein
MTLCCGCSHFAADMNVSQESDQPVFFGIERDNCVASSLSSTLQLDRKEFYKGRIFRERCPQIVGTRRKQSRLLAPPLTQKHKGAKAHGA